MSDAESRVHSAFTVRRCRDHPAQENVYYSVDRGRWECNVCGDGQAVVSLRVVPASRYEEMRRGRDAAKLNAENALGWHRRGEVRALGVAKELRELAGYDVKGADFLRALADRLEGSVPADQEPEREPEPDNGDPQGGTDPLDDLEEEVRSLKIEYEAAAALGRRRTEELDTLREWCRERGYLADDVPRTTSFDRELHDRLASARGSLPEREKR